MEKATHQAPDREALLERLKAEHRELESRLAELDRHISLTQEEQLERAQIKKLKLAKKDLIATLMRSLQQEGVLATGSEPRMPAR